MPEYLAPGVYVEETSFRSKSIEGVSTTTTGFVGPTLYGPYEDEPEILTSLLDFERTYGGGRPLTFAREGEYLPDEDNDGGDLRTESVPNYVWHAVRAFFENGGARLYVKRVYQGVPIEAPPGPGEEDERDRDDGRASARIGQSVDALGDPIRDDEGEVVEDGLLLAARYPGRIGARRVRITLERGQNTLSEVRIGDRDIRRLRGVSDRDVVLIERVTLGSGGWVVDRDHTYALARATRAADGSTVWDFDETLAGDDPLFASPPSPPGRDFTLDDLDPSVHRVYVVTVAVTDLPPDGEEGLTWAGQPLDPSHVLGDAHDSLFAKFDREPARRADRVDIPVTIEKGPQLVDGLDTLAALFRAAEELGPVVAETQPPRLTGSPPASGWLAAALNDTGTSPLERSFVVELTGGLDGVRPTGADYEGRADDDSPAKSGLKSFEDLEDISIVAAPGATFGYGTGPRAQAQGDTVIQALIGHCERMRYRIAVLDSGDRQTIRDVREMRGRIDSKHAALYFPWVMVLDPITQREMPLPPSGFVAGIYARNDRLRAVYKAPANEVVTGALRFETMLNRGQQEVLNPEGINCFRFFEGRGMRLWGARTVSSDPEWKYVNLRRYFAYLERSIDVGTQWAVFEPNGEMLWANVRRTIEDFLLNEFQMGALLGDKPEKAYFVKCDRSTMNQNDLDNGRLVCLIGVAALRPAEFVIFRIGQWTADRKV